MDGLSDILKLILPVAGIGTNIYSGIESGEVSSAQKQALQNALMYMKNPAKFQQLVSSLLSGLWGAESGAILPAVTRATNASLGGAGLGESPNMVAYALSQALGPYITSMGNTAVNEAQNIAFGGTSRLGTPSYPGVNMSQLLSQYPALAKALGIGQNTSGTSTEPTNWGAGTGSYQAGGDSGGLIFDPNAESPFAG